MEGKRTNLELFEGGHEFQGKIPIQCYPVETIYQVMF
jgi:hypothetical protein